MHQPGKTLAVVRPQRADHRPAARGIEDPESRDQVAQLAINAAEFGVEYYNELDRRQGVVHVVGPRAGLHAAGHDHRLR